MKNRGSKRHLHLKVKVFLTNETLEEVVGTNKGEVVTLSTLLFCHFFLKRDHEI